ncbi:MAG: POTRA domain-containing protein [Marinobacter sp.]|nr:POTRA domain-containing protein [Marinobacter sp.]
MRNFPLLIAKAGSPGLCAVIILASLMLPARLSLAQQAVPPTSADSIIEQQERQRQRQQERREALDQVPAPGADATEDQEADTVDETRFQLRSIRFTQTEQLSREELTGIVSPWLEQQVSLRDLFQIVEQINELYRSKEIFTSTALLPQQTVRDGVVIIQLVEGELGEVLVEGQQWTYDDWVRHWVGQGNSQDLNELDMNVLESNILLFNRLHDQQLQAQLRSGQAFGKTDIVVTVAEPDRNSIQLWVDNYGYETSGEYTLGFLYQRQKLIHDSDRGLVYTSFTEGSESLVVDYSSGIGYSRWRLGGSGSVTRTDIIDGPFEDADVESEAEQASLYSEYLVWSTSRFWADVRTTLGRSWSDSSALGEGISDTRLDRLDLTPRFTWLGADWRVNGSATYTLAREDDRYSSGDKRTMRLWYLTANGLWRFLPEFYVLGRYEQQATTEKALPGTLAFNLGGPTTIRGLKPGLISGDRGRFLQSELHYDGLRGWGHVLDLSLFLDQGEYTSAFESDRFGAAGVGASVYGGSGVSADLTVAKHLNGELREHNEWQFYGRLAWTW